MERADQRRKDVRPEVPRGRTAYTVEEIDAMAGRLRALPAIEDSKRTLNKQGVIKRLAAEIAALHERGYTIEQVAESLCDVGLEITTPTLKSYLQRMKKESARGSRKKAKPPVAPATPPERPRPSAADSSPRPRGDAQEATVAPSKGPVGERPSETPRGTNDEFLATDRKTL